MRSIKMDDNNKLVEKSLQKEMFTFVCCGVQKQTWTIAFSQDLTSLMVIRD